MRPPLCRSALAAFALAASAVVAPSAAKAEDPASPWEFEVNVHAWASEFAVRNSAGDDLTIGIADVLENLRAAGMGGAAARYGDFGVFADFVYANLADGGERTGFVAGDPSTVGAHLEMASFNATLGVSYDVYEQGRHEIRALAGARYLYIRTDLTLALPGGTGTFGADGANWDGVVGAEGRYRLADDFWLTWYADVGAGQSDFTFKVDAGFEWNPGRYGVIGGLRVADWDLDSTAPLKSVTTYGPYLGAIARF